MNYNEFKALLQEEVMKRVPEGTDVKLRSIRKNNGVLYDGITVLSEGENVAPTIYIAEYYERYKEGEALEGIASELLARARSGSVRYVPAQELTAFENIRDRIGFRVINYDMNAGQLSEMPHVRKLDLAITYFYGLNDSVFADGVIHIYNHDLAAWGISAEELHRIAVRNMLNNEPARLRNMNEISGMELFETEGTLPLYVLTNRTGRFGAGTLFYPGISDILNTGFTTDLYVLPSSVHEFLLIPDDGETKLPEIEEMVEAVNAKAVAPEEVLSNHVYRYCRETGELIL